MIKIKPLTTGVAVWIITGLLISGVWIGGIQLEIHSILIIAICGYLSGRYIFRSVRRPKPPLTRLRDDLRAKK